MPETACTGWSAFNEIEAPQTTHNQDIHSAAVHVNAVLTDNNFREAEYHGNQLDMIKEQLETLRA